MAQKQAHVCCRITCKNLFDLVHGTPNFEPLFIPSPRLPYRPDSISWLPCGRQCNSDSLDGPQERTRKNKSSRDSKLDCWNMYVVGLDNFLTTIIDFIWAHITNDGHQRATEGLSFSNTQKTVKTVTIVKKGDR